MKNRFLLLLLTIVFFLYGFLWVCPINAKEGKKPKEPLPPLKITILTSELGKDPSFTVPADLSDFWKIIEIPKYESLVRLIPNVRCLRIDIDEELEFKIKRPKDSLSIKARKFIGTWSEENERIHFINEVGKQPIGEHFSSKKPSNKTPEQLAQIVCNYSKGLKTDRILVYASHSKKRQPPNSKIEIGNSECIGMMFTNPASLMEYLKNNILSDMKAGELNYLVAYKLNLHDFSPHVEQIPSPSIKDWWHIGYGSYGYSYKDAQEMLKNNKDGWRLPSIDEMRLISQDTIPELLNDKAYWTRDISINGNPRGYYFATSGQQGSELSVLTYKDFDETDALAIIFVRSK